MFPYLEGHSLSSTSVRSSDGQQLIPCFWKNRTKAYRISWLIFFLHEASSYRKSSDTPGGQAVITDDSVLKREERESTRYLWDISKGWCTLKLVTWHSHGTTHFRKLQLPWREAEDKSPHNLLRVILIALKRQKIPEGTTVCMAGMKGKVSVCRTFILRDGCIYKYRSLLLTEKKVIIFSTGD